MKCIATQRGEYPQGTIVDEGKTFNGPDSFDKFGSWMEPVDPKDKAALETFREDRYAARRVARSGLAGAAKILELEELVGNLKEDLVQAKKDLKASRAESKRLRAQLGQKPEADEGDDAGGAGEAKPSATTGAVPRASDTKLLD